MTDFTLPTLKRGGRKRRAPWSSLPANQTITLSEAAECLQIQRSTLRAVLRARDRPTGNYYIPPEIEVIRDAGRVVGIRRNT